jgi:hypothetical protein
MLFRKALLPMVILASLTGCGPAAIDATTQDTLDASISKVASKLPETQRVQFGADVALVRAYYEKEKPDQLLAGLNGKSATDIGAQAANLREQQRVEQEKLAVEEKQRAYLADLQEKKTSIEEAIKPLEESKRQSIERAEFQVEAGKIGPMKNNKTGETVNGIELTVKNGTTQEIYSAMFNGVLSAKGVETPVLTSGFDVMFENPLQAGETRTVLFIPSMVSDWRSVVIPEGAEFAIEINELLNIANKPLFSQAQFSADDQESLDKLTSDLHAVNTELGVAEGGDTVVPPATEEQSSGAVDGELSAANEQQPSEQGKSGEAEAPHPTPHAVSAPESQTKADEVTPADPAVTGEDPAPADSQDDSASPSEPNAVNEEDVPAVIKEPTSASIQYDLPPNGQARKVVL